MSFAASQKNINEILSRNFVYNIQYNQRKYVWSEKEWAELFEDVFLIQQTSNYSHFLGSVVFAKKNKNNAYSVIDGQQRLITISVLFSAIINKLYDLGDNSVADSYVSTYMKSNNDGEECYIIEREDGPFFLADIVDMSCYKKSEEEIKQFFVANYGKKDKYNERIMNCYIYMINKIQHFICGKSNKKETLISLKEKLINCEVIEIIVDSDVDGYRVFETLNARGVPLEQHELLKNYLYSYMRTKTKQQRLESTWNRIMLNLLTEKTNYFPAFISHYCVHSYGKTQKNDEFKTIRANTPKGEVDTLLNNLSKNSIYYSYLIDPEKIRGHEDYSEYDYIALKFFKDMNIRQVRPLLMSLFEKKEAGILKNQSFTNCLKLLESFYFIYVVVLKNPTHTTETTITSLAKEIHNSTDVLCESRIREELKKYSTERSKFVNQFQYIGYSNKNPKYKNSSNKKIVNYVFYKFEKLFDTYDEATPKITSIEHIMCDNETDDKCSYIGNLLPMSQKMNGKVGSKSYQQKIEYYQKSKLFTVKRFVENYNRFQDWTQDNITARGQKLANLAYDEIWKM